MSKSCAASTESPRTSFSSASSRSQRSVGASAPAPSISSLIIAMTASISSPPIDADAAQALIARRGVPLMTARYLNTPFCFVGFAMSNDIYRWFSSLNHRSAHWLVYFSASVHGSS